MKLRYAKVIDYKVTILKIITGLKGFLTGDSVIDVIFYKP